MGLFAGSLPWAVMLFTPQPAGRSIDLVPLHDLPSWLAGDLGTAAAQVVGNLLVLAAFGFFLPMRFAAMASFARILAAAVATSVGIESLQWLLAIGRVSSVDDVLVNTLGAVLAAAVSRRWWVASAQELPRAGPTSPSVREPRATSGAGVGGRFRVSGSDQGVSRSHEHLCDDEH
ncbi:VanZ family protein [Actinoplanes sp. NPDC051346]|uniref:VanZ family protein n=1 Tax=Actinoplanes sp. NPDC051346 TaxID=3155048 RepID=UPI0034423A0C